MSGQQPIIAVSLPIRSGRRMMIGSSFSVIGNLLIKILA
jgi:hypothetical protein